MKLNVVFRVINPVKEATSHDGSVRRYCEVIVAWSELGKDGQAHEQRLLCKVWDKSLERLLQVKPKPDQVPMEVDISMCTNTSKDSGKVFNNIHLYLDEAMTE